MCVCVRESERERDGEREREGERVAEAQGTPWHLFPELLTPVRPVGLRVQGSGFRVES